MLAAAVSDGRTLVTADKEFGNVLAYPPERHEGVILVRIPEEMNPDRRMRRIVAALVALAQDDLRAAIAVLEPARLRIRRAVPRS